MRQSLLFFGLFFNTSCSSAQYIILDYKKIADKEILKYFDSSIIRKMNCKEIQYFNIDNSETYSPYFEDIVFEKVKKKEISFTYSYFSKTINDTFSFWVSLLKQKNGIIKITGLEFIPICLLNDSDCKFIKKDSALNIAIKDSIENAENLTSYFTKPYNKKDYYWEIEGNPVETNSTVNRRSARKISLASRKYINATTGKIISWQEYGKPDQVWRTYNIRLSAIGADICQHRPYLATQLWFSGLTGGRIVKR